MKLLNRSQKGFTLIELLIALPIIAIVVAAASGALIQVIQSTATSAHMVALRQVQTAGYWVSKDGLQAQSITTGPGVGFPLTLNWTDPATGNKHGVIYTLANKILWREHYVGSTLNSTTKVAEYISQTSITPAQTECVPNVSALTFTVTATVGEQSETRVYQVNPRTGS